MREKSGLTQHELARICGFGVNQISRYETGTHDPSSTALKKIATILDVSMDYLMGLTDEPHGNISPSDLNIHERQVVEAYRREGWPGVARLSVEKLTKAP